MTTTSTFVRSDVHTISLLVANKPGVLLRISLVFSRRGFNIESLVVSGTEDGRFSRMTVTAKGAPETLEQIIKQCGKLIDVVHAQEHTGDNSVERELALIKVKLTKDNRPELITIADHFKAQTADVSAHSLIIQVTGETDKVDAMIQLLSAHKIVEVVRTGKVVMVRGDQHT